MISYIICDLTCMWNIKIKIKIFLKTNKLVDTELIGSCQRWELEDG